MHHDSQGRAKTGEGFEMSITLDPEDRPRQHLDRLLSMALEDFDDSCLEWPGLTSEDRGAQITYNKRGCKVHRLLCEHFHGEPAKEGMQAFRSCRNMCCVNPRHLCWITVKDRARTCNPRGQGAGRPRLLSLAQVQRIRSENRPGAYWAAMFGVSKPVVSQALNARGAYEFV